MKIVVGAGYVGIVSGTCFAKVGVNVTCADIDQHKIDVEWRQFRLPSWGVLHKSLNKNRIIGNLNIYDTDEVAEHAFEYYCIGK